MSAQSESNPADFMSYLSVPGPHISCLQSLLLQVIMNPGYKQKGNRATEREKKKDGESLISEAPKS